MASQPTVQPGAWVQYNVTTQSPKAALPSPAERTIGLVRQAFNADGGPYYQVVWNPGDRRPKTGLYTTDQLTALSQQDANNILSELAAGTYQMPDTAQEQQQAGTNYQPVMPNLPTATSEVI